MWNYLFRANQIFSFFYQGVMIIPKFRKPEQLAGIFLHFPSYFIRIQSLFDRTNLGLGTYQTGGEPDQFRPKRVFQVFRPGGTNLDAPRGGGFLHASAQFVDFLVKACPGPDPGRKRPSFMSKNYAGKFLGRRILFCNCRWHTRCLQMNTSAKPMN